jgi:hypothetical protein
MGIGFASDAIVSSALRVARSSLSRLSRSWLFRRSRSLTGVVPSRSASGWSASSRSSSQRLLGARLCLLEQVVLGLLGDLQVGLLVDAAVPERVEHLVDQLARAALDQVVGHVDLRLVHGGVERGLAEVLLGLGLERLGELGPDVLAQLVKRVEAGGLGGEGRAGACA